MKKLNVLIILTIITICLLSGCGNDNKFSTIEDEVYSYASELQDKYGKISIDVVYAYCDGETQHLLLYYYGIGSNAEEIGDTYILCEIPKDGELKISDPLDDMDSLSAELLDVNMQIQHDEYNSYKESENEITYEEYKDFEKGYLPSYYASEVNDKLHDN